jgi:hypothetical protein
METTLNKIREHNPCGESWEKLLKSLNKTKADDEPLELRYILDTLGVSDAIWSLRSIEADRDVRLFACDCAESVLHIFEKKYPNDKRPRKAIEVSRLHADGKATRDELAAAFDASRCSADGAAYFNASRCASRCTARYVAWYAALGASDAAIDAARDAEKEKQKKLFIKYFC